MTIDAAASSAVPSLVRWGVSPDADLVYRTLVAFGPRTTARAALELGMPAARVMQALDELVAYGAVTPTGGRAGSRRWQPTAVRQVLALIRRRRTFLPHRLEHWRHQLAAAGLAPFEIDGDTVRRWPNRTVARTRIAELVRSERHEHLAINTEEVISAEAAAVASPLDRDLLARGLRVRTLGLPASDGDRWCAHAMDLAALGGEHRESDELPMKLMLFDRRVALFAADPTNFEAGAIELDDPTAVERLTVMFHRLWAGARDPRRKGIPPIVLTPREKAIVGLLADGHTEESVAAQLELSRRTVLYTLRGLMDRLGVENRFQLALVLGAAGATPLPAPYRQEDAS
jgi:DNA-binding CsgD family transcriptional regulator